MTIILIAFIATLDYLISLEILNYYLTNMSGQIDECMLLLFAMTTIFCFGTAMLLDVLNKFKIKLRQSYKYKYSSKKYKHTSNNKKNFISDIADTCDDADVVAYCISDCIFDCPDLLYTLNCSPLDFNILDCSMFDCDMLDCGMLDCDIIDCGIIDCGIIDCN